MANFWRNPYLPGQEDALIYQNPVAGVVELRGWSVIAGPSDPYTPPELRRCKMLVGRAYGHPTMPEGARVQTSCIKSVQGRLIETVSGRRYKLGKVAESYVTYLKSIGKKIDPKNPIKVI